MARLESSYILLLSGKDYNNSDLFALIEILEGKSSIKPMSLEIPERYQWIVCGYCWALFLIGSYFKKFFYSFFLNEYKQKKYRPIDVLTLPVILSQHVTVAMMGMKASLAVITGSGLEKLGLEWFCWLSRAFVQFDLSYSAIGSLLISVFRILYIKHGNLVKGIIQEKKLMYMFLLGGFSFSVFNVVLLNIYDYNNVSRDTCYARPTYELRQMFDEYELSKGNEGILESFIMVRAILIFIGFWMVVTEFFIYVGIFHFIYKNDNNDRIRRLLNPSVIRSRNKTNAITLLGQFCSFVVEITIMILLGISIKFQYHVHVFLLRFIGFAAMSIVEVISSASLRQRLLNN